MVREEGRRREHGRMCAIPLQLIYQWSWGVERLEGARAVEVNVQHSRDLPKQTVVLF